MDFDDLLPIVGDFGPYQKLVFWFILLPAVFPCGFHAYNQIFMTMAADHWCKVPELQKMEVELAKNISIPLQNVNGHLKYSKCEMYDWNYKNLSLYNISYRSVEIIPCKHGWVYDSSNIENSITTEWDLVCKEDFSTTIALVLFGAAGLVGNYIFGFIQDGLGRKPAFFIYLLIQCIFGTATAFASSFIMWTIFRLGVGFTVPAILGTPYVLAIELVGPKHRTSIAILINIAYSIALVTLAVLVWALRQWRILALATTVPFYPFFLYLWFLPESPRWLLAEGHSKRAEQILAHIAKVNGREWSKSCMSEFHLEEKHTSYGVYHLFQGPNLRWKTIIITFIWFTNTSVYVGLSYYAPSLGGDEYFNFFLACAIELPTYIFLWPSMEKWGRKVTLCISMVVGGGACLATFFVQNNPTMTLALFCVGKMGISSSFVVLPLMASELYPTVVRGLGISISSVMGMLGPVFIPLINYLGYDMLALPLMIMGGMLVLGGISSLLLPETLHQHLPQTLEDAERDGLINPFSVQIFRKIKPRISSN